MTQQLLSPGDEIVHSYYKRGVVQNITANGSWATALFVEHGEKAFAIFPPFDKKNIVSINGQAYSPAENEPVGLTTERLRTQSQNRVVSATSARSLIQAVNPEHLTPSDAERKRQLQQAISKLRRDLSAAHASNDVDRVDQIRAELVEHRVEFCRLLRPLSDYEAAKVRELYTRQTQGDFGVAVRYNNVCWFCGAQIADGTNDQCPGVHCRKGWGKSWYVCACGACLCPDMPDAEGIGKKVRRVECDEQRRRLGNAPYEKRLRERLGERGYQELQTIRDEIPF